MDIYSRHFSDVNNAYADIIDQAPDAVVVTDLDGRIQSVNQVSQAIFEGKGDPLLGRRLLDLLPERRKERVANAMDRLVRGESGLEEITLEEEVLTGTLYPVTLGHPDSDQGVGSCLVGVFRHVDIRKEKQGQYAERASRQRDVLVREVHHRIKNHLQGLVGLVSLTFAADSGLDRKAEGLLTQINSIAVIHGLQSKRPDEFVNLCDTVNAIGDLNESLRGSSGRLEHRFDLEQPAVIVERYAVAVALVVNELIGNALKHSCRKNESITVLIRSGVYDDSVELVIRNPGTIDVDLLTDVHDSGGCSGLSLVYELLPSEGARLHVENCRQVGCVETLLELSPPVVSSMDQEGVRV